MNEDVGNEFMRLVDIMSRLRRSCPWDAEQTPASLRQYVIEEAYEVVEAIEGGDTADLREELGDLLLQVIFQAEIADERGLFHVTDVLRTLSEKLIRRHPHVFGDVAVSGSADVLDNWEQIKREEKVDAARLESVPRTLPALLRAARVISKCQRTGLALAPAEEITGELPRLVGELVAPDPGLSPEGFEHRLGQALLLLAGLGQRREVNPEDALRGVLDRAIERLHAFEETLSAEGRDLEGLSDEQKRRLSEDLRAP